MILYQVTCLPVERRKRFCLCDVLPLCKTQFIVCLSVLQCVCVCFTLPTLKTENP